jgi:hypothetical protein
MLDRPPRWYTIDSGDRALITREIVVAAMSATLEAPTPVQQFIRDSFDSLFFRLGHFEQYLESGLVADEDIQAITDFYVARMAIDKATYTAYLQDVCRNKIVFRLLKRFKAWTEAAQPTQPTTIG